MFSTNLNLFTVTVNSDAFNQSTNSYDIDFKEVNRSKSKYNDVSSRLVCENGWAVGWGGGK